MVVVVEGNGVSAGDGQGNGDKLRFKPWRLKMDTGL